MTDAVPALIEIAETDPDLFVKKAALQALGALHDDRALPLLMRIRDGADRFLAVAARKSLELYVTR